MSHLLLGFGFYGPRVPLSKDWNLIQQCPIFIVRVLNFQSMKIVGGKLHVIDMLNNLDSNIQILI